jgi:uncharacterized protein (TIGR03083 family)
VADLDEDELATPVPACPEWSVRDAVAHLTGVCTDIISGNIDGASSRAWTGAQVDARRRRGFGDVLAEWDDAGPQIATVIDDFPEPYDRQVVADIAAHEQDLRGALGVPGERDSDGVSIGLDFLVSVILDKALTTHGLGALEVRASGDSWLVGGGPPPVGTLAAEPFELFRAISGRRSAAQIRGFEWSVDSEAYLAGFGFEPFTTRSTDLLE